MSNWLENYVYRTNIGVSLLVVAALTYSCNDFYNNQLQGLPGSGNESGKFNKNGIVWI